MDGIEATPAAQKAAKAAAASSETAKTVKLAIAIVGLLIGGALIAWNLGVFGTNQVGAQEVDTTVPADVAGGHTPIVKQSPSLPTTQPNQPKSNMNFH